MSKGGVQAAGLVLLALMLACQGQVASPNKQAFAPPAIDSDFVQVEGETFTLRSRAVRFVGANAALVHGAATREAAADTLTAMNRNELRVVRLWALGETDRSEEWMRASAFRTGPDEWVEESFVHLDHVLAAARAQNVRVIVVLGNRWRDHGGLPQYARWAGIPGRYDNLMPAELAQVLMSPVVRQLYLAHIVRIVSRINTVNHIAYADDATILAWEIFNEISASTCAAQRAIVSFLNDASAAIRVHDTNHLIVPGHIGYNSEQSRRFWHEIHALEWVGYADTHGYPQNLLAATTPERFADWLSERAQLAQELQKPLVVGEVGVPREWEHRRRWFEVFFARADEEGVDAVLPWIFRPHDASRDDAHGIWETGPHASESVELRDALSASAKRFSNRFSSRAGDAEVRSPFPVGVETIRPYVHGEWEDGVFRTDPWGLAEGCADGEGAFALYGLRWLPPVGALQAMELPLGEESGWIDISLDGVHVGAFRDGDFEATPDAALPSPDAGVAWLRLAARDSRGASSLARFTAQAPEMGELIIRVR